MSVFLVSIKVFFVFVAFERGLGAAKNASASTVHYAAVTHVNLTGLTCVNKLQEIV